MLWLTRSTLSIEPLIDFSNLVQNVLTRDSHLPMVIYRDQYDLINPEVVGGHIAYSYS